MEWEETAASPQVPGPSGANTSSNTRCKILSQGSHHKKPLKIRESPFYNLEDLQKLSSLEPFVIHMGKLMPQQPQIP